MFNDKNAILAKNLHVDSFKYQSTEDIPNADCKIKLNT